MILDKIVNAKKIRLRNDKFCVPMEKILNELENNFSSDSSSVITSTAFYQAIKKEGLSIIGEIKKASPSKGIIREDFDPIEIARNYEGAVDCLSILTEQDFFLGNPSYIKQVKAITSMPILRKDFVIDEYQIYEAKYLGASAVLLICAILSDIELKKFIKICNNLKLTPLVEVHTEEEVYRAINCGANVVGINNRNLKNFIVDINTTLKLSKIIPSDVLIISESGISTKEHIALLKEANIDGVLIGETFMKCQDIKAKAKEFKLAYEG